jgi:peptidoglycan/LPS O-acetylase OafA/YrhL
VKRLPAIDALRFVFAFWVVMHHAGPPPEVPHQLDLLWRSFWLGPAAVLGFFVISGFCIHGPTVTAGRVDWRAYFVRRYVRVGVPFAAIFIPAAIAHVDYDPFHGAVTWSLICELVYYTVYPGIRLVLARVGFVSAIVVAYALGYGAVAWWSVANANGDAYVTFRLVAANLPVWLVGCWIADMHFRGSFVLPKVATWWPVLMACRFAAAAAVTGVGWLSYRNVVSAYWTMPALAALAAPWLWAEFIHGAPRLAAWVGRWSYSLYLIHVAAITWAFWHLGFKVAPTVAGFNGVWLVEVGTAVVAAYGYYLIVERPAHVVARRVSRRLARGVMPDNRAIPAPANSGA